MQLIVLFRQLLVFLLERHERLLVELFIMLYHTDFRLQLLVSLRSLKKVVEQLLNKLSALSVYKDKKYG